ncbi:hypothetical protein QR680_011585 [Steinernema hermaphroditum]|uniref:MARVEL domain-containing protein n=1 Tax=Steinernema hermaphroditum TaxID=289476 RepID=A0AA39LZ82_9BILA|nr:hypothetical protein QR680_011585 [Steinernema hermaphroditum]
MSSMSSSIRQDTCLCGCTYFCGGKTIGILSILAASSQIFMGLLSFMSLRQLYHIGYMATAVLFLVGCICLLVSVFGKINPDIIWVYIVSCILTFLAHTLDVILYAIEKFETNFSIGTVTTMAASWLVVAGFTTFFIYIAVKCKKSLEALRKSRMRGSRSNDLM